VYLFNLTTLSKIVDYAALNSEMVMNNKVERIGKDHILSVSACTKRDLEKPRITSADVFYPKNGGCKFLQSAGNHLSDYGVTSLKNAVLIFPTLRTSILIQSNQESSTAEGGAQWTLNRSFSRYTKTFGQ
jgi:hypothetical protein